MLPEIPAGKRRESSRDEGLENVACPSLTLPVTDPIALSLLRFILLLVLLCLFSRVKRPTSPLLPVLNLFFRLSVNPSVIVQSSIILSSGLLSIQFSSNDRS